MRAHIAPEDFDAALSRYPYQEKRLPEGYEPWIRDGLNYSIEEPMVYCYSYSEPGPGGGLHVSVFANEGRNLVYVHGGVD